MVRKYNIFAEISDEMDGLHTAYACCCLCGGSYAKWLIYCATGELDTAIRQKAMEWQRRLQERSLS